MTTPLTRATADLLLDKVEAVLPQKNQTLSEAAFWDWFATETDPVADWVEMGAISRVRTRLAAMLASVGKSPPQYVEKQDSRAR